MKGWISLTETAGVSCQGCGHPQDVHDAYEDEFGSYAQGERCMRQLNGPPNCATCRQLDNELFTRRLDSFRPL